MSYQGVIVLRIHRMPFIHDLWNLSMVYLGHQVAMAGQGLLVAG
jgi:hypothetical protein